MQQILKPLKLFTFTIFLACLMNCSSQMQTEHDSATAEEFVVTGSRIRAQQPAAEKARARAAMHMELKDKAASYHRIDNNQQIFKTYGVNPTIDTKNTTVSTFAMDVDNSSYKLASHMLENQRMPHSAGIRVEEFVNSLEYNYAQASQKFAVNAEVFPSPFRQGYHVLHVGIQTQQLTEDNKRGSNLVLVADVSGSMASDNKLALLKQAFTTLVSQLDSNDQVAIVGYSDDAFVVLPATKANNQRKIMAAINSLETLGSTNAEEGILLAYEVAEKMYLPGFNNRVIITSDGMANVGSTDPKMILNKIEDYKQKGIFLTTVGVGLGMYNDYLLEQLANKGNGNYLYVGNQGDIQSAFVDGLSKQLQTVAKDSKVQIKFNPNMVSQYRLLGYENRALETDDFTDATKDGGEIGAGHSVTVIYEIKLANALPTLDFADISIAYKLPQGEKVNYIHKAIPYQILKDTLASTSSDSKLSIAMAAFAEKLRQSYWSRAYRYNDIVIMLDSLPTQYQQQKQVKQLRRNIYQAQLIDDRADPFESEHPISKMNFDRVPVIE
ncbi:vWA domain-containing protein [Thalassotalea crassostreae]|uniref:vWA domain-containing protein n=1 Tax=Thalassotalea crassostreae TaxID=1763536 RepID=UPI00083868DE|nr:von Willebrand factor type A domain-containing protein [Thalassotalea crassostreae]